MIQAVERPRASCPGCRIQAYHRSAHGIGKMRRPGIGSDYACSPLKHGQRLLERVLADQVKRFAFHMLANGKPKAFFKATRTAHENDRAFGGFNDPVGHLGIACWMPVAQRMAGGGADDDSPALLRLVPVGKAAVFITNRQAAINVFGRYSKLAGKLQKSL